MFKRINKYAIIEAVRSEEVMAKQIKECLQYRKTYGVVLLILMIPLLILFLLEGHLNPVSLLIAVFILIPFMISAYSNNSRLELLQAISELKLYSNAKEHEPTKEN